MAKIRWCHRRRHFRPVGRPNSRPGATGAKPLAERGPHGPVAQRAASRGRQAGIGLPALSALGRPDRVPWRPVVATFFRRPTDWRSWQLSPFISRMWPDVERRRFPERRAGLLTGNSKAPAPIVLLGPLTKFHASAYIALQQWTCGELPSDDAYPAWSRKPMTALTSGWEHCGIAYVAEQAAKDTS
jgi:hypothetical protein